jgi:uncharacterized protein (TIGR00290 family)
MCWSGGKDSCVALHELLKAGRRVAALLTTVTADSGRISMHGVRRELLERQAAALGLPLVEAPIPKDASNDAYETAMKAALLPFRRAGVAEVAFGDLFLEQIRAYRDALMARFGMRPLYPVWGRDTAAFVDDFIDAGFRAIVICVDGGRLPPDFAGREIDRAFVADLPTGIDPCGENGDFHSFVFDGPLFREPVRFTAGELVSRGPFWFRDLVPAPAGAPAAA